MENQEWIAKQIHLKNMYACPYESLANDVTHVVTDVDHFPYTRFYRGVYNNVHPQIWMREAGFKRIGETPSKSHLLYFVSPNKGPAQIPCSTILPRTSSTFDTYASRSSCFITPP
jgi:hypothetical protein